MKKIAFLVFTALTILLTGASAKKEPVPHIYMFGMAASFTDTIVFFTPIQQIDSAWIDTKSELLQERQAYSYQLRDYLNQQQNMPHRTCIVFYSQKREKLEKKYQKMLKLYTNSKDGVQHFDVRHLDAQQFQFHVVSAEVIEEGTEEK